MGFSSVEAKSLVDVFSQRGLLGQGVGRLLLALAQARDISVREAGTALLSGEGWEALPS
jgi:D-ornithine 4,5-aminomutase subunit alpha